MDKWTALLPERPHLASAASRVKIKLIGRLPVAAYIVILQHLPVADVGVLALANRQLSALAQNDEVWKYKLGLLDYEGPGACRIPSRSSKEGAAKGMALLPALEVLSVRTKPSDPDVLFSAGPVTSQPLEPEDDEFGDFFTSSNEARLAEDAPTEDLFGDFHDSQSEFGLVDEFAPPDAAAASNGDDLMMSFDDEVAAPTRTTPVTARSTLYPTTLPAVLTSAPTLAMSPTISSESYLQMYIKHHTILLPYYLSLITHTTSSLLFTSSTLTSMDRSYILSALTRFCTELSAPTRSVPQRMTVLRNVQSASDFFESAMLAEFERADSRRDEVAMKEKAAVLWALNKGTSMIQVFVQKREIFYESHNALSNLTKIETPRGDMADGIDFTSMDGFMKHVLHIVAREGGLIARVFPPEADVLIYFTERIANDVISDYITTLLSAAQPLEPPLFLLATAATFGQVYRLVDAVLAIEPKCSLVTKERAEDVIFHMFEPLMDDYLSEEADWIRNVLEELCSEWDLKTASDLAVTDPTFLASQNPAQVKRNVLAGFTKVLLLPVTIIPKTAVYGFNVISVGATGAFNTVASLGAGIGAGFGVGGGGRDSPFARTKSASTANIPASPGGSNNWNIDDASVDTSKSHSRTGSNTSVATVSTVATTVLAKTNRFDRMQLLLSLDTALQLIQSNRDCLKRVQTFVRYPGAYGQKVRDGIEEVFIILLQAMGESFICQGFSKAILQMSSYQAKDHVEGTTVAPLVQFFELVHIGDTIQQMVQVYYDKEMAEYIDKKDFLNAVVREKKRFETAVDDSVAQGLNAGVNILMKQVEYILATVQGERDFNPPEGVDLDLQASVACRHVIECLNTHCNMLKGSTDKQILEVFHQEVGIRLHGILLKHLKQLTVSVDGGFPLISDLNAYHTFVSTLRQPNITAYFTSLKMVGEIFIVDSPKDLGQLVRDVARYEGTLSAEDLYEICKRRADWRVIEAAVDKQLFGLKMGEDCIVS